MALAKVLIVTLAEASDPPSHAKSRAQVQRESLCGFIFVWVWFCSVLQICMRAAPPSASCPLRLCKNIFITTRGGGLEAVVEFNGVETHAFFDLEVGGFK